MHIYSDVDDSVIPKHEPKSMSIYVKYSETFYTFYLWNWVKSLTMAFLSVLPLVLFKHFQQTYHREGSIVDYKKQ